MGTRDAVPDGDAVGVALVLVSAAGFGTLAVLGEYAFAAGLNIPSVLALRFGAASVVLWPLLLASRSTDALRLRGRTLGFAVALGLLGYTGQSALFFWGLEYLTAGMTTLVLYTYPVFVLVLSRVALGESLTARRVLAVPLALGGVVLVAGADPAGVDPVGVVIVLGSAVVYSGYITVSRVALDDTDGLVLAGYVAPAATLSFLAYGSATGSLSAPATVHGWLVVAGIAVLATALPMVTFFAGVSRVGASRAGLLSTLEPVVAVALGAVLLAEPVTVVTLAGGVVSMLVLNVSLTTAVEETRSRSKMARRSLPVIAP